MGGLSGLPFFIASVIKQSNLQKKRCQLFIIARFPMHTVLVKCIGRTHIYPLLVSQASRCLNLALFSTRIYKKIVTVYKPFRLRCPLPIGCHFIVF